MKNLEGAANNFDGRLVSILKEAGFESASEIEHMNTIFGPVWFHQAIKAKRAEGE